MKKAEAIHAFFSGICTAYPSTAVVDSVPKAYLTYTPVSGMYGDGNMAITINIYCQTDSEAEINVIEQRLSDAINHSAMLTCDDGLIWIKRGKPWCQSILDPTDRHLKRRYINAYIEYLTYK